MNCAYGNLFTISTLCLKAIVYDNKGKEVKALRADIFYVSNHASVKSLQENLSSLLLL